MVERKRTMLSVSVRSLCASQPVVVEAMADSFPSSVTVAAFGSRAHGTLMFAGKPLDAHTSLRDQGVRDTSLLTFVPSLRVEASKPADNTDKELRDEVQRLEATVAQQQETIFKRDEEIAALKTENAKLCAEVKALIAEVRDLRAEVDALRNGATR